MVCPVSAIDIADRNVAPTPQRFIQVTDRRKAKTLSFNNIYAINGHLIGFIPDEKCLNYLQFIIYKTIIRIFSGSVFKETCQI
jgi:hypothetical protein